MQFDIDALDALRERAEVHRRLGPGLLESIYRDALLIESVTLRPVPKGRRRDLLAFCSFDGRLSPNEAHYSA